MNRGVVLGLAVSAAAVATIPVVAYVFPHYPTWLNPYRSRAARWSVYVGGVVSLVLFIALARSG